MVGHYLTLAGGGVTDSGKAEGVGSVGGLALDNRGRVHLALIRKGLLIAQQSPGAGVTIVELVAVQVDIAVACDREPHANRLFACISHGAGVPIITIFQVCQEIATAKAVANVIGTGIIVVAIDGSPDANTLFAVIADGAGITVQALPFGEGRMSTSVCTEAGILSTGIVVITDE